MKTVTQEFQKEIVSLVLKGEINTAHEKEAEARKNNLMLIEDVNRLYSAYNAGRLLADTDAPMPSWINNNYLEQCYAHGFKNSKGGK